MFDRRDVLVVEDHDGIRETMTVILEMEGYAVTAVTDGREALAILETGSPRFVILDMWLPYTSGWAVMEALRSRERTYPILLLTADPCATDEWADELGADAVLTKPFDIQGLLDKIAVLQALTIRQ